MNGIKLFAMAALAAATLSFGVPASNAQVSFSVGIAPACPYGYYDYTPYSCAPYGYYGPEWFHGRRFIGVGPWFHGPENFRGHVNNNFDRQHGYNGRYPDNGERPRGRNRVPRQFRGNEMRDGRGHVADERRGDDRPR